MRSKKEHHRPDLRILERRSDFRSSSRSVLYTGTSRVSASDQVQANRQGTIST